MSKALQLLFSGQTEIYAAACRSIWISLLAVVLAALPGLPVGILLARWTFPGRNWLAQLFQTGMALPTVFVGLVCFSLFSRNGPLGSSDLLYTPWVIVFGEFILAFPIWVTHTRVAVAALDPRIGETARVLGAGWLQRSITYLTEARHGVLLAFFTAFARCVTELGIAMMVGGNLKGSTRTLATATALETSRGQFATGMAMGILLLVIALTVTLAMGWIGGKQHRD
ncbi:MAG: ABC transporter permease [Planctomycetota bacterium]|nr:ABC transporter permease [Planctomycetota bacterium]